MELSPDLAPAELARALPGRPLRAYPALLSTQADALAWARAGAPDGALVVADYQASPRGRAGFEWQTAPGTGLGFSLVLRPRLPVGREGWPYVAAAEAIAGVLGESATLAWPDEVRAGGGRAAALSVDAEPGAGRLSWAVVNVLVPAAEPPRAPLLARLVEAICERCAAPSAPVLAAYLRRCETLGRRVRARLVPLGPAGTAVEGTAATVLPDGALVIETDEGRRVAVPPQALGLLDELARS